MKPKWEDIPDWVNWLVMDCQGRWWGFENQPTVVEISGGKGWDEVYGDKMIIAPKLIDWKNSIEKRPEEVNDK